MKFHVLAANKDTGEDVELDLLAADSKQAEQIAHDRGLMVSAIKIVDDPVNLDPIELEPETASSTATAVAPPPTAGDTHAPRASGDTHAPGDTHVPNSHDTHTPQAHADGHHDATPHPSTHMEYKLMQNQALFLLEKSVNKMILEGWEPIGGLTIAIQNNAPNYFQALVRHPRSEVAAAL